MPSKHVIANDFHKLMNEIIEGDPEIQEEIKKLDEKEAETIISGNEMAYLLAKYGKEFRVINSWLVGHVRHFMLDLYEEERFVEVFLRYDHNVHSVIVVEKED